MRTSLLSMAAVALLACGGTGPQGPIGPAGPQGPAGQDAVFPGTDGGTATVLVSWTIDGLTNADTGSCPTCSALCTTDKVTFFTVAAVDEGGAQRCSVGVSCQSGRWWSGTSCKDIPSGIYRITVTANSGTPFTGPQLAFRRESVPLAAGDSTEVRVGFFSGLDF